MPHSKNKQPKKLASLTQKELREIYKKNQQKLLSVKPQLQGICICIPKCNFIHIYVICFCVNVCKYIFTQFQFSDLLGKFV